MWSPIPASTSASPEARSSVLDTILDLSGDSQENSPRRDYVVHYIGTNGDVDTHIFPDSLTDDYNIQYNDNQQNTFIGGSQNNPNRFYGTTGANQNAFNDGSSSAVRYQRGPVAKGNIAGNGLNGASNGKQNDFGHVESYQSGFNDLTTISDQNKYNDHVIKNQIPFNGALLGQRGQNTYNGVSHNNQNSFNRNTGLIQNLFNGAGAIRPEGNYQIDTSESNPVGFGATKGYNQPNRLSDVTQKNPNAYISESEGNQTVPCSYIQMVLTSRHALSISLSMKLCQGTQLVAHIHHIVSALAGRLP